MNAIIVTGGKQYKVAEGDVVYIEKLPQEAGDAGDPARFRVEGDAGHAQTEILPISTLV